MTQRQRLLNLLLNFAGTQLCSLQHRTNTNVRYSLEVASLIFTYMHARTQLDIARSKQHEATRVKSSTPLDIQHYGKLCCQADSAKRTQMNASGRA